MEFNVESLQRQIPYYLTAEDRQVLVKELHSISSGHSPDYILSAYNDHFRKSMLQGDGWKGFQIFLFDTGEWRSVNGLVLSNSCDIDPGNPREVATRIIFAPLVKLSRFKVLLDASGIDGDRVKEKISSIKTQKATNVFYLPPGGPLKEGHVVRLDEMQSMPVAAIKKKNGGQKLFTLNNTGFYMLVLKLSVHFCRLQEKINRRADFTAHSNQLS